MGTVNPANRQELALPGRSSRGFWSDLPDRLAVFLVEAVAEAGAGAGDVAEAVAGDVEPQVAGGSA